MKELQKRHYIKDSIWGEVELFSFEKPLLSTSALNRLHSIIQNASAFRVYPGLNHSRFSHSIGVMHVASQLYRNLCINLALRFGDDQKKSLLLQPDKEPDDKSKENPLLGITSLDAELGKLYEERGGAKKWILDIGHYQTEFMEPLQNNVPSSYPERYALGLAAVRMAGLIHDIGHLPYSHTAEFALKTFLLESSRNGANSPAFVILEKLKEERLQLHELLGEKILSEFDRCSEALSIPTDTRYVVYLGKAILFSKNYPILRSMISSAIDADRIDYVRRDSEVSGFQQSCVDYRRLFHSTTLVEFYDTEDPQLNLPTFYSQNFDLISKEPKKDKTAICRTIVAPSTRATSDVEKLLRERFSAYRYIYNHHKVRLFDILLQRCVEHLAAEGKFDWLIKWLSQSPDGSPHTHFHQKDTPYQNIESPDKTEMKPDSKTFRDILVFLEVKLTDTWLDSNFKELWQTALEISSEDRNKCEPRVRWLLWAISGVVQSRTDFLTGFKNPDQFWETMKDVSPQPQTSRDSYSHESSKLNLHKLNLATRLIELEFLKKGHFVMFGVQEGPESVGADSVFLKRFQLEERCADLIRLTYQSPYVNFWYRAEKTSEETIGLKDDLILSLKKAIKAVTVSSR